ncbi:MAG: hypothetical protein KAY02_00390, partial [Acidovorax sp.]|nr:hypothetical protein [Acidovorax sp.]
ARQAQGGRGPAAGTVNHMRRAGQIHLAGERRVDYRNRPVAEYVPTQLAQGKGCMSPAHVLQVWAG